MIRAALWGAALVSIALGAGGASEWSAGERAMRESDDELAQGNARQSIVHARRAAEAAVPFSPYPARGYDRLEAIARAAEVSGRPDDAAFAWRAMRSAAVATRPAAAGRGKVLLADQGIQRVARAPGVLSAPAAILSSELEERP